MEKSLKIGLGFLILIVLSFFKDSFSPDSLNSENASFMKQMNSSEIFQSHLEQPLFWICAYLYTTAFILLPWYIIKYMNGPKEANVLLLVLICLACVEYISIYINHPIYYRILTPKINRYLHSPFITIFYMLLLKLHRSSSN